MRGKSATKTRSGSSTPPARDVDLLDSDQFLSAEELDELWEWFYTATAESLDPELVFVKIINSARNPYRQHIPAGYQRHSDTQDLISLDHEDEVDQLKHLVTSLRAEVAAKDQVIASLEAKDERFRESEKQLVREIAEKEREIEKRDERLSSLEQEKLSFDARLAEMQQDFLQKEEALEKKRKETKVLQRKRDELGDLLEKVTREHLNNGELVREVLRSKEQDLERWKQQSTLDKQKLKQLEEELVSREKELQEMGNDYGRKLAEKERELDSKQVTIEELNAVIESQDQHLSQKLGESETKHMESRRDLISTVCAALAKKSLTPAAVGLQDEEWTIQRASPASQRTWPWR